MSKSELQYGSRDRAFREWASTRPGSQVIADSALRAAMAVLKHSSPDVISDLAIVFAREAFKAGWNARKLVELRTAYGLQSDLEKADQKHAAQVME